MPLNEMLVFERDVTWCDPHGVIAKGCSQVVIAHLHSLVMRLRWDAALQGLLETTRLVFMPIVNPGGMNRENMNDAM